MGVLGLWRLLDPTGKPVPVETLEGKVLAIDVSIWIHQVLQGYQDRKGDSVPNAHLLGLFNRICKLLYFKIKPVFVFDGGVPLLKKNTIASRRKQKSIVVSKAQKLKNDLINNLIKRSAVNNILDKKIQHGEISPSKKSSSISYKSSQINDLYILPEQPSSSGNQLVNNDFDYESDYYDSSQESSPTKQSKWIGNINTVNVDTDEFKSLPADVRYDILTDLKDTRKQNSWGRIHEMPQVLNDFSDFQMKRLLKRRYVQESLQVAEKEMGGSKNLTLEELDKLLTEQGIKTSEHDDSAFRIASDSSTRVIFVNDKNSQHKTSESSSTSLPQSEIDLNLVDSSISARRISVSSSYADSEEGLCISENMHEYNLDDDWDTDSDVTFKPQTTKSIQNNDTMETVKKYMLEYSSLTEEQILAFIKQSKKNRSKSSKSKKKLKNLRKESILKQHKKRDKSKNTLNEPTSSCANKTEQTNEGLIVIEKNNLSNALEEKEESCSDSNSDSDFIEISKDLFVNETISTSEKSENNGKRVQVSKVQEIMSESSDSDSDFVTIEDVPIPAALFDTKVASSFNVIVKPEENLENDLFADVFAVNEIKKPKIFSSDIIGEQIADKILTKNETTSKSMNLNVDNLEEESTNKEQGEDTFRNRKTTSESMNLNLKNLEEENINEEQGKDTFRNIKSYTFLSDSAGTPPSTECDNDISTELVEEPDISSMKRSLFSRQTLHSISLPNDEENLILMKNKLENEEGELSEKLHKLERQSLNVTDQIRTESQELLRLFGIPYIVAPMEAEAQCAYLEQIDLTDGTITDDSDIWLFGGKCVYKNFFNNNKKVLQFQSCDIQHHFKLSRQQLVQLALLVGSDYTSGLSGIGPVTALEILAAFPSAEENMLQGLTNFSAWVKSGKAPAPGRTSLRNKLKNVQIEKSFPSEAVVKAYLFPTIDESKEKFTWGKPNLNLLSDYVKKKFGWTKLKFEEVINPVMKKLTEGRSQKGIDSYFQVRIVPKVIEKNLSKRIQTAVKKLSYETIEEEGEEEQNNDSVKNRKKRKVSNNATKVIDNEDSVLFNRNLKSNKDVSENISKEELKLLELDEVPASSTKIQPISRDASNSKTTEEYIPQRESARAKAAENKIRAVEVFKKSKARSCKKKGKVKPSRKILKEAELSENSD